MSLRENGYDWCDKHQLKKTGFSKLFCSLCVQEEDNAQKALSFTNPLEKVSAGALLTATGFVACFEEALDSDKQKFGYGDLIFQEKLIRFTISEPKTLAIFIGHGLSGKQVTLSGEVRKGVAYSDRTTDDLLVKKLKIQF